MKRTRIITDREIYREVVCGIVPQAEKFLWIGTADIKNMHVERGKRMVPFLALLADLIEKNVMVRLIHAREPGPRFREEFDRRPALARGLERMLCPRVHFKCVVVDGVSVYTGSANITGAGMGARGDDARNFETGLVSTEPAIVHAVMERFDRVWRGEFCRTCRFRDGCAEYPEMKR